jgi:MoaA/NifB/PqqE/SkfB family radical SAM enzyme
VNARSAAFDLDAALAPPLPRFAQIEPMPSCNLACRMCTVPQRPGGTDVARGALSLERFLAWLDQLPGLAELQLQGLGEPLLNPALIDMIRAAKARGIRVGTNSNLTLLTVRRAHALVDAGLDELSISIDGATRATYERIRVGASFDKLVRNIDRIVAARAAHGAGTPALRLVMVLMRHNVAELPALVELAAAHGVDAVLVQRLAHPLTEPTLPARYIPVRSFLATAELRGDALVDAQHHFDAASARAAELGVRLSLPRLTPAAAPGCRWPWEGLYLTADGAMLPCCMVGTPDRANFGDAAHGIAAAWRGEAAQAFRAALDGPEPPSVCRGCALYRGAF